MNLNLTLFHWPFVLDTLWHSVVLDVHQQ
jgi:hypothetical protein